MESYLIGFDIGTLSSKAVLTDLLGNIVAKYQSEHDIFVEKPGYQEESMDLWWDEFKAATAYFLEQQNVTNFQIKAIGITGLVPALCAINKDGDPIRNAMLHTDVRAQKELDMINNKLKQPITHGCMLPKLMWVKGEEPENYNRIHKVMVPHGYIGFKLTGIPSLDYDTATIIGGMFDSENLTWDKAVMKMFDLEERMFPTPCKANTILGTVTKEAAIETGLSMETKVIAGVGDTFASMLGGGAYNAKQLMIYLGTSATILYAQESPKHYIDIPHYGDQKGHFVGRILSFGESIMHLRNNLRYDDWSELNQQLNKMNPGTEGLWYFPHYKQQNEQSFFGQDAEYMLGYRGKHTGFHMYHATLEGIAYNIRYNISNFNLPIESINLFGGGANSKEICQLIANVVGRSLTLNKKRSTALGIAFLAGFASGEIKEFEELEEVWFSQGQVIEPDETKVKQYDTLYHQYQSLRAALMDLDSKYSLDERKAVIYEFDKNTI